MKKVSITSHIGRSQHDLNSGKDTRIQTASDLAHAEKHNNHNYTQEDVVRMESAIDLSLRHFNKQYDSEMNQVEYLRIVDIVKATYHEEFDDAVSEYNSKQCSKGHPERCIADYYDHISKNEKAEVAVEGILQIGDMEDWEQLPMSERLRIEHILLRGLDEIKKIPGFRFMGASFHVNESSPHFHYIGICIDETQKKTGLSKRISKSAVFNREILSSVVQDKVREVMEPILIQEFGWEFKEKETGRNKDLSKKQLQNEQLQKENERLQQKNEQLQKENEQLLQVFEEYKSYTELEKTIEISNLKKQNNQLKTLNTKLHNFILSIIKTLEELNLTKLANTLKKQYQKLLNPKQKELER